MLHHLLCLKMYWVWPKSPLFFAPYGIVLGEENARTVGEPLTPDPSQHHGQATSARGSFSRYTSAGYRCFQCSRCCLENSCSSGVNVENHSWKQLLSVLKNQSKRLQRVKAMFTRLCLQGREQGKNRKPAEIGSRQYFVNHSIVVKWRCFSFLLDYSQLMAPQTTLTDCTINISLKKK